MSDSCPRCRWANPGNPLYLSYHDREWGRMPGTDRAFFEILILEGFQAGLSWECILNKREGFREAFAGFDPQAVAALTDAQLEILARNPAIVRNRLKIRAAKGNARVFLAIVREFGSFRTYVETFTGGVIRQVECTLETVSPESEALSKDLRRRGMRFVGPTVMYSFLQACGFIHAHEKGCFLFAGNSLEKDAGQ